MVYRPGNSIANWLQAVGLEAELFESIMEDQTISLQRRGLINAMNIKSRWSQLEIMYEGDMKSFPSRTSKRTGPHRVLLVVASSCYRTRYYAPNQHYQILLDRSLYYHTRRGWKTQGVSDSIAVYQY